MAQTGSLMMMILITSYVTVGFSWGIFDIIPIFGNGNQNPIASPSSKPPPATGLKVGFYKGLCPNKALDVEGVIAVELKDRFLKDPTILPALLRMQFHDCFVRGCDASILIAGNTTERKAGANLTVRGFELIDALKAILEAQCPNVVSCADIIAIATKVLLNLGGGIDYSVQTGRRDGLRSSADDVNLPSPTFTASQSISAFAAKNFTAQEMVILLGGHTVGVAHCEFFQNRLYSDSGEFDTNMDSNLRTELILTCPKGPPLNKTAFLDQNVESSNKVDNSFYSQIMKNRGLLPIDQALARDNKTKAFVQQLASDANFNTKLANAMIKLQALDVLTGLNQGQIRKICSKFN